MRLGALGIKIMSSGRLNGIEIARCEWYREGRVLSIRCALTSTTEPQKQNHVCVIGEGLGLQRRYAGPR
jgi:hypothetical protein